MMDVHLMRHIVDDVERGALPDVAQTAAARWCGPGGVDTLVYVRSSANHLFRFLHEGRPRFLRLAHEAERRPSSIAAELAFVQHVAGMGLAVAQPVASANGLLVEDVSCEGQRYYAVVFEGLRGRQLDLDDLDEAEYRAWGRALALVHRASQTFPAHPARPSWHDQMRAALHTLPPEETAVAQVLTAGLRWLETLAIPDQDYGLIHGDFELDNLIWDGQRVQALDFDDATYAWYAVDFAAALQDVWLASDMSDMSDMGDGGDASKAQREQRIRWFAEGYAALRPLPGGLPEALPRLLTLLLAVKVARLLRAYATTTDDSYPAWLARMRTSHQRWLEAKRAALIWE